jgi:cytochrome P450
MEQMRPRIQQVTETMLAQVAQAGQMDIIADYALPLPVVVICELLGIPAADQAQVADWSQAIISPGSRGLSGRERKRKMRVFVDYLGLMFANRRREPQDDLVTALVQAKMADDALSEAELSSMVALLLVTGHETTVNLIGNGVLVFLQQPEQLQLALTDEQTMATAVEELLRFDGPVETSTTRWVGQDVQFKGHTLQRGDVVRLVFSAANRDAAFFAEPDQFVIRQHEHKHLAFGHGIHYCLGAPLARLEGSIAFQTLFKQFPNLRLQEPAEALAWRSGVLFRGLERLPVVW